MSETQNTAAWDDVSYIVSSDYRTAVCQRLMDGAATPSTIAEATGLKMAHSSRSLKQLRERGMVELLVSESVFKGRVYGLTDTGKAAWTLAEDEEML